VQWYSIRTERNRVAFAVAETRSAMNRKIYNVGRELCITTTAKEKLLNRALSKNPRPKPQNSTQNAKKPLSHHSHRQNKNKSTQH